VPEVTGLLIPPGYPEAISEAVLKLLLNREQRLRMGAAARKWVLQHYTNERVLGLLTSYYKSLLEEGPQQPGSYAVKVATAAQ
jgi:glycosyltransferase involved in cell wall biosynthesis